MSWRSRPSSRLRGVRSRPHARREAGTRGGRRLIPMRIPAPPGTVLGGAGSFVPRWGPGGAPPWDSAVRSPADGPVGDPPDGWGRGVSVRCPQAPVSIGRTGYRQAGRGHAGNPGGPYRHPTRWEIPDGLSALSRCTRKMNRIFRKCAIPYGALFRNGPARPHNRSGSDMRGWTALFGGAPSRGPRREAFPESGRRLTGVLPARGNGGEPRSRPERPSISLLARTSSVGGERRCRMERRPSNRRGAGTGSSDSTRRPWGSRRG